MGNSVSHGLLIGISAFSSLGWIGTFVYYRCLKPRFQQFTEVERRTLAKEARFVFVVGFALAVAACVATNNVLDHLPHPSNQERIALCVIDLCVAAALFVVTFLENIFGKPFSGGMPWANLVISGLIMLFKIFQLSYIKGELDLPAKITPFIFGALSTSLASFATTLPLVFHSWKELKASARAAATATTLRVIAQNVFADGAAQDIEAGAETGESSLGNEENVETGESGAETGESSSGNEENV